MNRQQIIQFLKADPLRPVMLILMLAIVGVWVHLLLFERKITQTLSVPIDFAIDSPETGQAADRTTTSSLKTAGPAGHVEKTTTVRAKTRARSMPPSGSQPAMDLPKDFEELLVAKAFFGAAPAANYNLQSIWGESALINGQWLKRDQPNGNMVLRDVGLTTVVLEVNGQRQQMAIWPKPPK